MPLTDLIIRAFCLIDDALADFVRRHGPLRRRGPRPTLADSEVLTVEVVGALLEIDTDAGLYRHVRRHHAELFPALTRVHRTTFTRHAAALWAVKAELWQHLVALTRRDARLSIVDSFPVPVCRFARATFCQRFADVAAYGRDEAARQTFYGLRAHVRVEWPGVVVACDLAPGNVHDLSMVEPRPLDGRGGERRGRGHALGRPGVLEPEDAGAVGRTRRRVAGAVPVEEAGPGEAGPGALAVVADADPAADRDRLRPVRRPLEREASVGARPMAPDQPVVPEAVRAHAGRGALSGWGPATAALLGADRRLKPAHRVSYQYGLASNGSPWLLGAALASRWDPAPETWAVRPYFVPVAVGLYVDGGAYAGETSLALGTGTGFGVEVPVGSVALAVEARSVNLLDSDGGSIPVSVGLRF